MAIHFVRATHAKALQTNRQKFASGTAPGEQSLCSRPANQLCDSLSIQLQGAVIFVAIICSKQAPPLLCSTGRIRRTDSAGAVLSGGIEISLSKAALPVT
jgi:hypothetical protein